MLGKNIAENTLTSTQSVAGKIHVKNIINTLLWLSAIFSPLCLLGAWIFEEYRCIFIIGVFFAPVLAGCFYSYFVFKDPDRLQSEKYQIEKQAMQIIVAKNSNLQMPNDFIKTLKQNINEISLTEDND